MTFMHACGLHPVVARMGDSWAWLRAAREGCLSCRLRAQAERRAQDAGDGSGASGEAGGVVNDAPDGAQEEATR